MSGRSKPSLSSSRAEELIAEVQAADRDAARLAVGKGVEEAQEQWIEASLIAEALIHELVALVENNNSSGTTATYLRELAQTLDARSDFH